MLRNASDGNPNGYSGIVEGLTITVIVIGGDGGRIC
jgi:hypothetical protein